MDRRDLLKLGGAAALAMLAPSWSKSVASAGLAPSAKGMLVLADPRYSDSLVFARSLESGGATLLPLATDLAALWFGAIEPRLKSRARALAGLTLQSDLFVLERLAESSGAVTRYVGCHDWRCRTGSAHRLSGSIDLGEITQALASGEGHWAEALGGALIPAAEASEHKEGRQELSMELDHAAASDSPRFFVSWLMNLEHSRHDPEKWKPVFRKDHAPARKRERCRDDICCDGALGAQVSANAPSGAPIGKRRARPFARLPATAWR
jgi:hypothetical protein